MIRVLVYISIFLFSVVGVAVPSVAFAQLDNQENPLTTAKNAGGAEDVAVIGTNEGQEDALLNIIKSVVNRTLGILGLIALIIVLYGGFLMLTAAGNEDRYSKGRTILKHALIGLVVIGISWMIVSFVFWLVNKAADGAMSAESDG